MRRLAVALLLVATGCGPSGSDGARLPAGIEIRGIQPEQISAVQLTVLSNGSSYYCGDLAKSCLNQKIKVGQDTVAIRGDDGKDHNALRVSGFSAQKLTTEGVSFSVSIPAGTNYMVVAEILSADAKLLASGCEVRQEVVEGDENAPLVIKAQPLATPPSCDPRID